MRFIKLLCVPALVAAMLGVTAAAALAASPYPINMTLREHKTIEYDPGISDLLPCFTATGDLTEVYNGQAYILAAGIDPQGNFVGPLHYEATVEESVHFVPLDQSLPTYSGHSTIHLRNIQFGVPLDSPNVGFTNTVVLRGTDGSQIRWHEDAHLLLKATGMVLFVDHVRCSVK